MTYENKIIKDPDCQFIFGNSIERCYRIDLDTYMIRKLSHNDSFDDNCDVNSDEGPN